MTHICEACDRLQGHPCGTAPNRPTFQQPTMYDHFANFQNFKQLKGRHQEELLKCQTPYGDAEQKLENAIENQHNDHTKGTKGETTTNLKSLQKKNSLWCISRSPINCPISACKCLLGVSSVLSHILRDHHDEIKCQEIYLGNSCDLLFNPKDMIYGKNICLGVLAYGGATGERSNRPAERGICLSNAFLPMEHEHLNAHFPILIMACRTSWTSYLAYPKGSRNDQTSTNENPMAELFLIWLTSVQTTKPIHCTLTVYDKLLSASRSSIMRIRNLSDTQNPSKFMSKEVDYMRLCHGDIEILSQRREEPIHMEIVINEYELNGN
uniref:DUF4729 domain-containing protein n=1 Tax=Stomoxys calcitrans TaxID=35570 RepID=A0A1I8PY28_STOCA